MKGATTDGSGQGERGGAKRGGRREMARGGSGGSGGRIALVLSVIGLVLIVLFLIPRGGSKTVEPLPPAAVASANPINLADPTSGKPVVPGIASVYKGYTIGHCCAVSKTDWENLTVAQKDAAVRRFLR